jgi:hypothetical protein
MDIYNLLLDKHNTDHRIPIKEASSLFNKEKDSLLICKGAVHRKLKECKTVYSFIRTYLSEDTPGGYTAPATFYAKKPSVEQCGCSRNRSLGDLFFLAKSYFPKTTLQRVAEIIMTLYRRGLIEELLCHTVERRVYFWTHKEAGDPPHGDMFDPGNDEFGLTCETDYIDFIRDMKLQKKGKRVGSGSTQGHKNGRGSSLRQHADSKKPVRFFPSGRSTTVRSKRIS